MAIIMSTLHQKGRQFLLAWFLRKSTNTLLEMDLVTHVLSPQQLESTMEFCCDMGMSASSVDSWI
jgi:hypothetical protein